MYIYKLNYYFKSNYIDIINIKNMYILQFYCDSITNSELYAF